MYVGILALGCVFAGCVLALCFVSQSVWGGVFVLSGKKI